MTGEEYQNLAMRTKNNQSEEMLLEKLNDTDKYFETENGIQTLPERTATAIHAVTGLPGEVGETLELVKKWLFHGESIDPEHLEKEIGDIMWYVAELCEAFNLSLDVILRKNIEKLKERYPEGYSVDKSLHRKEGDI